MAVLARDEEAWWQSELARLAPQLLLQGRPVRGGGRAAGESGLALDVVRLAGLAPAVQRRLLRHAAGLLGAAPDFVSTEALRALALTGRAGQKRELAQGLRAERTPRELRMTVEPVSAVGPGDVQAIPEYRVEIPGQVEAHGFGLRIEIGTGPNVQTVGKVAKMRNWRAGDRVRLRYSSSPRKVKEVLERLRVTGSSRVVWPVLELDGRIVWMKGVELEPEAGLSIVVADLEREDG
jgi:tRNA(Ile)-lysidine synthase